MGGVAQAWGYGLWEAQLHWNGPNDESWKNEAGQTTQGLACRQKPPVLAWGSLGG